ncbi:N-acetylglucosamine-6-phosphate deacetylase [Mucilaginibacter sp. JRF]|uniref:N-acetylglucosamine-6-phosphate deacetylase n=1 Tax=Mucilaginibacter sp. JRF TaxID=2780088 RepID=UPI001881F7D9|nr:N-acetylglucosamine-6-phosphate deacetylase [Mucilaginibacter sp. JRF]MBE9583099.1 N-acetylglucosamine-6-phosphate deacetylase [Mucilaginibacter sp. JRF]
MDRYKIFNGKVITPAGIINNGCVLVEGDKILEVTDRNIEFSGATDIDAGGKYISPGFIDIHVHGGGGHDFMDNTLEAFLGIAQTHARYGTTALTPTTLSCEKADLLKTLELYELADKQNTGGAQFIGIHIEGPYFAMSQRGAQDPRYIREPVEAEYKEILSASKHIKRWSAAPEVNGALAFGEYMTANNVLAAIAHTDAIYEDVIKAYEKGFTHATHFYSCMSGVTRRNAFRYAGVIESAYLIDGMTVEIIADGRHLPAPLLKLVHKIKGTENIALITDAMRAAGMPPGESILGSLKDGLPVIVEDDVAKLPDRSSFAGSVATADRLVRNMVQLSELPLIDAVKMATETPARIMKVDDTMGSLEAGKLANIIIFDEDITIDTTMINGKIIYVNNAGVPVSA